MNKNDLNQELLKHLNYLKTLSNREYLLVRKYYELKDFIEKTNKDDIMRVKENMVNEDDIIQFVENIENDNFDNINLELKFVDSKQKDLLNDWTILRKFTSVLHWSQNPGRNLKFLVMLNNKYLGVLSLGSDIISIGSRDEYIGWDKDTKLKGKNKRLNHISIASSIVSTQPFGYILTGGKLLSLLLYHNSIRSVWNKMYKDTLVGITTTSLFGIKSSQYNGMKKYWRPLGETKGLIYIQPLQEKYLKMREYLKENHIDELREVESKSGPKNNAIKLYYKKTDFNKLWKKETGKTISKLNMEFKRGVYFSRFYDNTIEYLRGEIEEKDLKLKSNLDFDINSTDEIIKYWWRKYGKKRWSKKNELLENESPLFMDEIFNVNNVEEFLDLYRNYKQKKFSYR